MLWHFQIQKDISSIMWQTEELPEGSCRFMQVVCSLGMRKTGFIPTYGIQVSVYCSHALYMQLCTEEGIKPLLYPFAVGRNEFDVTVLNVAFKSLHF